MSEGKKVDTRRGLTKGGSDAGPSPGLRERVVSGDRNTGDPADKQARQSGEMPRDKPVEEEADKDKQRP